MLGDLKENETGDMAQLLNEFERLSTKLDVTVAFAASLPEGEHEQARVDRPYRRIRSVCARSGCDYHND